MQTIRKARLIKNGASQAVRSPAEIRFEGGEKTLNVTSSGSPEEQAWKQFLALRRPEEVPVHWMLDRPMNRLVMDEEPPLFREDD